MSCRPKRRHTPTQEILRLLHRTHREVHQILAILSNPDDFSKEDRAVKRTAKKVDDALNKITPPRTKSTVTKKGK